ncbi:MAG: hypothetical protein Q4A75_07785 [Peptostreptococcaceae bacterium]|nr:hypothetical protein [Peptostreptococcaceae bacterium]
MDFLTSPALRLSHYGFFLNNNFGTAPARSRPKKIRIVSLPAKIDREKDA